MLKTEGPNTARHISHFLPSLKVMQGLGHLDASNPGSSEPSGYYPEGVLDFFSRNESTAKLNLAHFHGG